MIRIPFIVLIFSAGIAHAQQVQDAPRNMGAVECTVSQFVEGMVKGSWAHTLDLAQDQEAKLRIEVANASTSAAYANQLLADLTSRIANQEAEIARLKAEFGKRRPTGGQSP